VIRSEVEDGVLQVTLDRPDARNALTVEMRDDLVAAVRRARADDEVRAVLLSGAGGSFCAGMDLRASTVVQTGTPGFDPRSTSEALRIGVQTLIRELWELDKPTVAAVDGPAVGPGAHLALACDLVLVHPGSAFVWTFAKWGLVVDAGGAYLLPRLLGPARAKELVLLGGRIDGEEAVRAGLAMRCCADADELSTQARETAGGLAHGPTRSLGLSKQLLNRSLESDLPSLLEREGHFQALATASADLVEGMAAFRERRDPKFTGH
jgi:2-(1,2-epoxy-1,2-dihydrophenyl)acetyl-CoA isomerase